MEYDFTAFSNELANDEQTGQFIRWKEQPKTFKTDPSNILLPRYNKNGDESSNNNSRITTKFFNSAYENYRDKPKLLNSPF